jgi:nucleotide-binding universal stress UspA family protein
MELFSRLLVPVDFSEITPRVVQMARRMLAPQGRCVLLHVVETLPTVMEGAYGVYAHRRDVDDITRLSREKLQQVAAETQDERVEVLVREGKPAQAIVEAAEEQQAEVIVIGSHGRSGLDHLLVGSVTERVLRKARCHVFMVRG